MLLEQCYQLLDIPMNASEIQIKKAYRKKAKILHPDANKNENAKYEFQTLNEAYHYILANLNTKLPEEDVDTLENDYRKYGTSIRNKTYKTNKNHQEETESDHIDQKEKLNRSPYDSSIFWFFLILGLNILVYGLIDVFKQKENETTNYNGVAFAIPFLVLLIWGWILIKKHKD